MNLPTVVQIYQLKKRLTGKNSSFYGCIDARKGIFNNLLIALWQSMQSNTDESHRIKNLLTRSPMETVGEKGDSGGSCPSCPSRRGKKGKTALFVERFLNKVRSGNILSTFFAIKVSYQFRVRRIQS